MAFFSRFHFCQHYSTEIGERIWLTGYKRRNEQKIIRKHGAQAKHFIWGSCVNNYNTFLIYLPRIFVVPFFLPNLIFEMRFNTWGFRLPWIILGKRRLAHTRNRFFLQSQATTISTRWKF